MLISRTSSEVTLGDHLARAVAEAGGDLPIIGSFFRNFDYKRQDKELVIIVTPRLVQPLARNTELPLPGEREAKPHMPEWGAWLLGPISQDPVPGFSR